jgi:hypothetical protein
MIDAVDATCAINASKLLDNAIGRESLTNLTNHDRDEKSRRLSRRVWQSRCGY